MLGRTLVAAGDAHHLRPEGRGWTAPIAAAGDRLDRAWHQAMVDSIRRRGRDAAGGARRAQDRRSPSHGPRAGPPARAAVAYRSRSARRADHGLRLLRRGPRQGRARRRAADAGGSRGGRRAGRRIVDDAAEAQSVGCALVLAAASRMPGLVASYLTAMTQEHERGVGGIQAEWPIVSAAVQSTGAAVAALAGGHRRPRGRSGADARKPRCDRR